MRIERPLEHPGRIALVTAALFIGALIGPCSSAGAGPGEARLGLVVGLAIALTAARRLRHVCCALDDGDGDHGAS